MITLTELAAQKVQQKLQQRGQGIGISVGVKITGCSGLAYVLEYIDNPPIAKDWMQYSSHGVTVWVNGKDLSYVRGLIMDFKRQGLNEGFEFVNPNETARCGCGESFRV